MIITAMIDITALGYPWQNATASLKRHRRQHHRVRHGGLSVAKRHGLIEASVVEHTNP